MKEIDKQYQYWIIDVSAGIPKWGYSFAVKRRYFSDEDMITEDERHLVVYAARDAGLFRDKSDWCGCSCHEIGYDAQVNLEDWADDAVEIDI